MLLPEQKPVVSCTIDKYESRFELGGHDEAKAKEDVCRSLSMVLEALKKGPSDKNLCNCSIKDGNMIRDGMPLNAGAIEWVTPDLGKVIFVSPRRAPGKKK
jgi:hypothetical protein